jgi:hypothetical protein
VISARRQQLCGHQTSSYVKNAEKGRVMNKEYWQAKADLCRDLALVQIKEEDTEKEAGMNLMRMTYALSMVEAYSDGTGE